MATLLALEPYATDWLNLLARWLHVIAGIVWIGSSFYFIALDNHLLPPARRARPRSTASAASRGRSTAAASTTSRSTSVAPHDAARAAALVQVGGVHDLAERLRAADRPLLRQRGHVSDRPSVADLSTWRGGRDQRRRCSPPPGSSTTCSAACSASRPLVLARGAARARSRSPRGASAHLFSGARDLYPGRRDARHDDGRQRLLRDHPRALGARARETGGSRARSGRERARQAALGAQQLPDAAGRLHDALQPLPVHLRAQLRTG